MNYEQLYIDGVLMDTDEKTSILLELKSNLFADISKMASNKTYTIHLPKTVHNLTVLGHADRIGNNADWPYRFHSARFFRNGIELIKDGRAALLSAADDLEIAIVWGLSSPFAKLKEGDKKLNDLTSSAVLRWDTSVELDAPSAFFARGYGYAGYSPWVNGSKDEGWQSTDVTEQTSTHTVHYVASGYIPTGEKVGDIVLIGSEARANWGWLSLPFYLGCTALMNRVKGGTTNDRLWAVLDADDKVISIAPPSDGTTQSVSLHAPSNAATLLVNIDTVASEHNYIEIYSSVAQRTPITFGGMAGGGWRKLIHPSVAVRWVLDQLQSELGITCSWSGDALTLINSLAIPLVSRKANYLSQSLTADVLINPKNGLGKLSMYIRKANSIFSDAVNTDIDKLTVARDCGVSIDVQGSWDWNTADTHTTSSTTTRYGGADDTAYQYIYIGNYVEMTVKHTNDEEDVYIIGKSNAASAQMIDNDRDLINGFFRHIIAGYGHIELTQGDEITFEMKNAKGTLKDTSFVSGEMSVIMDGSDEVLKGNDFPIAYNLPDIKVTDFIKFLAAITATFPLQSSSDTITFVPISDVWANIPNAVDWTRKVIPAHDSDKPKQLDFKLSDWAQQNWYRWASDEKTIGNYDGHIDIADATLDATRDVVTFPFAASDGSSIPTYERAKVNGTFGGSNVMAEAATEEPQFSECKPRIMNVQADGLGKAVLRFNLNMQDIITAKYNDLAAAMQNAKVIKENVRLSNIEILNFDERTPVYLAQHASYFAVLEIKAASNGSAEVTMLKIK